jgi:hypothetical protein
MDNKVLVFLEDNLIDLSSTDEGYQTAASHCRISPMRYALTYVSSFALVLDHCCVKQLERARDEERGQQITVLMEKLQLKTMSLGKKRELKTNHAQIDGWPNGQGMAGPGQQRFALGHDPVDRAIESDYREGAAVRRVC